MENVLKGPSFQNKIACGAGAPPPKQSPGDQNLKKCSSGCGWSWGVGTHCAPNRYQLATWLDGMFFFIAYEKGVKEHVRYFMF